MVLTFLYSAARKLCPHLIMGIQPWFLKGQESLLSFSRNENVEIILEAIFFFFLKTKNVSHTSGIYIILLAMY